MPAVWAHPSTDFIRTTPAGEARSARRRVRHRTPSAPVVRRDARRAVQRVVGPLVLVLAIVAVSCSKPEAPRTADELRTAIDGYRQSKPDATPDRIEALFARLDADIAKLRADAAAERGD